MKGGQMLCHTKIILHLLYTLTVNGHPFFNLWSPAWKYFSNKGESVKSEENKPGLKSKLTLLYIFAYKSKWSKKN